MKIFAKILVTVGAIIVVLMLFVIAIAVFHVSGRSNVRHLVVALFLALCGAICAIWKKDKNDDDNDETNSPILQE